MGKTNCIKENFQTQTRGHGLVALGKICSTSKLVIEFLKQEILDILFLKYVILRKKGFLYGHSPMGGGAQLLTKLVLVDFYFKSVRGEKANLI